MSAFAFTSNLSMIAAPAEELGGSSALTDASAVDAVVSAAVLATVAFRLKDERGVVRALRKLANAVDALERAHADA